MRSSIFETGGAWLSFGLFSIFATPVSAQGIPPAECRDKYVGRWTYSYGETEVFPNGTAQPKGSGMQKWSCSGNQYFIFAPGGATRVATLSADGSTLTGPGLPPAHKQAAAIAPSRSPAAQKEPTEQLKVIDEVVDGLGRVKRGGHDEPAAAKPIENPPPPPAAPAPSPQQVRELKEGNVLYEVAEAIAREKNPDNQRAAARKFLEASRHFLNADRMDLWRLANRKSSEADAHADKLEAAMKRQKKQKPGEQPALPGQAPKPGKEKTPPPQRYTKEQCDQLGRQADVLTSQGSPDAAKIRQMIQNECRL